MRCPICGRIRASYGGNNYYYIPPISYTVTSTTSSDFSFSEYCYGLCTGTIRTTSQPYGTNITPQSPEEKQGFMETTKHNGTLGKDSAVAYYKIYESRYVQLYGGGETWNLKPEEALSLLSWLEQEKDTIEQLANPKKEQEKGTRIGRLYVDRGIEPEGVTVPTYGYINNDLAMISNAMDAWKTYLCLPEQCTVAGVFFDVVRSQWLLLIQSEEFPPTPWGEYPPLLNATYQRQDDGSVKLIDLKVER